MIENNKPQIIVQIRDGGDTQLTQRFEIVYWDNGWKNDRGGLKLGSGERVDSWRYASECFQNANFNVYFGTPSNITNALTRKIKD